MNRYVSVMTISAADPLAQQLKRTETSREREERRKSDRSALWSIFSAFLVLLLGGVGLVCVFALLSWAWRLVF
jgi:hypothetical protein